MPKEANRPLNPFIYSTPDQIKDPKEALDLFVDVLKDFYLIESPGNTFINGARGSGKSMMFRIMKPDCQKIKLGKPVNRLNYFAVYVPVKNTSLNIMDLDYLKGKHGEYIFNEHFMTVYFAIAIFECLREEDYSKHKNLTNKVILWYNKTFIKIFKGIGYKNIQEVTDEFKTINEVFARIVEILEELLNSFSDYIQNLTKKLEYSGPICQYRNFLLPLIKEIAKFEFLPKNKPIYILVDDADCLNLTQTCILNSWVSFRSTSIVCYKITTQLTYKTFRTANGQNKIDSPHDYHEINLSDIYTSNPKTHYKDNVKQIVERRLKQYAKIKVPAEKFFPADKKQEEAIKKIMGELKREKGYDYAYRHARLNYMLQIPNEYSYSYGGFDQLVHLSSGIIRNFIDLSFKMFDKTVRENPEKQKIDSIPISIQNEEIRAYTNWFLLQLNKTIEDKHLNPIQVSKYKMLRTLLNSIGNAFRQFLESDTSERRKFSFYFDGEVSDEIKDVLKLGESEGFLHYSTHGSKTGLGRSHKYVLNRMLSPVYKLDPFTFSGYLYLTPEKVELAVKDEKKFRSYIEERIKNNDEEQKIIQLKMELL